MTLLVALNDEASLFRVLALIPIDESLHFCVFEGCWPFFTRTAVNIELNVLEETKTDTNCYFPQISTPVDILEVAMRFSRIFL